MSFTDIASTQVGFDQVEAKIDQANKGSDLEKDLFTIKSALKDRVGDLKSRILNHPDTPELRSELAKLRKITEKLLALKNGYEKGKIEIRQDSRNELSQVKEDVKIGEVYAETQTALAEIEGIMLDKKIKNDGWNKLSVQEKISYFSDLDMKGGAQEFNTTESSGFLWLGRTHSQKFVVREKQVERELQSIVGNDPKKLDEVVTRLTGETVILDSTREKFVRNLVTRVETMAILTRGMGKDFQSGLSAVLRGREADLIKEIEKDPKFQENLKNEVSLLKKAGLSDDQIWETLKSIGVAVIAQKLGLVGTYSEKEAGKGDGPLEKTLVQDEKGGKNVRLKATLLLPSGEVQFNWNDRDGMASQVRAGRMKFIESITNSDASGFDLSKLNTLLEQTQTEKGDPAFDAKTKEEIRARVHEFDRAMKSIPEDQKKRYFDAVRSQWAGSDVREFVQANEGWDVKGVGIGLLLVFPFIKLNVEYLANRFVAGERNLGTGLESKLFREKKDDLKALGLTKKTDAAEGQKAYEIDKDRYLSVVLSKDAPEKGVSVNEAGVITAPKGVGLEFSKVQDTQSGAMTLQIGIAEAPKKTTEPVALDGKADYFEWSLDTEMLGKLKIRKAFSELPGLEKIGAKVPASSFSNHYHKVDRRDDAELALLQMDAVALLRSHPTSKDLHKLANDLAKLDIKKESEKKEVTKTIDSIRFGMMTDIDDSHHIDNPTPKKAKHERYKGDKIDRMLNPKIKSSISGKSFADALASTGVKGIEPNDFKGLATPQSHKEVGHKSGDVNPRMIAMVGTWKMNPANMSYMPMGAVYVATDSKGKKFEKTETNEEKKSAIYDMFMSSEKMFQKYELKAIEEKVKKMTMEHGKPVDLSDAQKRDLVTGKTIDLGDGRTLSMANKFSYIAYGACANPSVAIELGAISLKVKGGEIVTGAVEDTGYAGTESPVGALASRTADVGVGASGSSLLEKGGQGGQQNVPDTTNPGGTATNTNVVIGGNNGPTF